MNRRRALTSALTIILLVSLVGCGSRPAGDRFRAQVIEDRAQRIDNPVRPDSSSARVGPLRLLQIRIQRPDVAHAVGGDSAMFLTIANSGTAQDELVAVSSVDARQVILRDGADEPEERISVPIPADGVASLQYIGGPHLEIRGLKRELTRRQFVPMTFRFKNAGPVSVKVFVEGVDHPVVSPLPEPRPTQDAS